MKTIRAETIGAENMTRGFTIKIFVPNGSADGLRIVEKSNWSGRGIVCPRSHFGDNRKKADFNSTGVYVLIGPSEENDIPESESIAPD